MSEHWKSTPKYWCKHCSCYVRDTKLERQTHEATGRHQGAIKRSLRDLHRGHEREEREKERARREIARLDGVVSGKPRGGGGVAQDITSSSSSSARQTATEADLRKQREQLAELGVAMPSEFRPEMAMAGEWTVTSTRVVHDEDETKVEAKAAGVRKREITEEEKDEENAVNGLFKKPRRWGRDSRAMPAQEDKDLEALLSGSVLPRKDEAMGATKRETSEGVKAEDDHTDGVIKKEEDGNDDNAEKTLQEMSTEAPDAANGGVTVKTEDGKLDEEQQVLVSFKKRKPKPGMRKK